MQILALAGEKFFYALAAIQLAMVFLVPPAATAGAVCNDRASGILAQLAATELSNDVRPLPGPNAGAEHVEGVLS